jgi:hypothetical protein
MSKVFLLANDESTIYNFRRELIQRLIEDGHIVMVAFPRGGSRTDEIAGMGCHYIDLPMERKGTNPIKDVILISRIKKVLNRYSPDVLLTFTIKPNLYGGYVSNSLGIPHIANITGRACRNLQKHRPQARGSGPLYHPEHQHARRHRGNRLYYQRSRGQTPAGPGLPGQSSPGHLRRSGQVLRPDEQFPRGRPRQRGSN